MEKYYCSNCEREQESEIITKKETLNIKGQSITCIIKVRRCLICKEEIIDSELDNESLQLFYNEYKRKNNLLLPSEIKKIREKYELSQSVFAKLLGFGEKTITRYENGAIQDFAHDNLIRLMDSIDEFEKIWDLRQIELSNKENKKIEEILKSLKQKRNNIIMVSGSSKTTWSAKNVWSQQNISNIYNTRRNYLCPIA